jgi:hypothetical protein
VISSTQSGGRVTISCSVANIVFDWRLEALPHGGTAIGVHVEVPDAYELELESQKAVIGMSLQKLADVAARDAAPA